MEMKTTTFKENARTAIADETLQIELDRLSFGFPEKRKKADYIIETKSIEYVTNQVHNLIKLLVGSS